MIDIGSSVNPPPMLIASKNEYPITAEEGGPDATVTGTAEASVIISSSSRSVTDEISVISYTDTVIATETGVCPELRVIDAFPFEENVYVSVNSASPLKCAPAIAAG